MYYDFVEANQDVLERVSKYPLKQQAIYITLEDQFPKRFANDERYNIIKDFYRLKMKEFSHSVRNGEYVSDVFCFNPEQIKKVPLREYDRCIATVTWQNKKRSVTDISYQ